MKQAETYGSFEYLKVKETNEFDGMSHEDLVKLAQKDMDEYRFGCRWKCPNCEKSMSYKDSLKIVGEEYLHEVRISNLNIVCDNNPKCKKKMDLIRDDNKVFYSRAFDQLFAKYQGRIVIESEKAKSVDSPEEIYGELCASFSKIVGMFARNTKLMKTSERWFSSFFYRSIQNKISDIQKTKNYQKRSPMIMCEVCGEYIGKVTSKHLTKIGHESLIKDVYRDFGMQVLYDSGEDIYYKSDLEKTDRAIIVGIMSLSKRADKEDVIRSKALSTYSKKYPNSQTKNNLLSTNMPIDEEQTSTLEDTECDSVTDFEQKSKNTIGKIFIKEFVDIIVEKLYDKNNKNTVILNKFFNENIDDGKKIEIIKEILLDKLSYSSVKNAELDRSYSIYVKFGFTARLLRLLKNDNRCRIDVMESLKI